MFYNVQVYDEYVIQYIDGMDTSVHDVRSYKKVNLDILKKNILKNFFDCYLDPKTKEIIIPELMDMYKINSSKCYELRQYYTQHKQMHDDFLQKIESLTEESESIEYEIPSSMLYFEDRKPQKILTKSIIYVIPFIDNEKTKQGE